MRAGPDGLGLRKAGTGSVSCRLDGKMPSAMYGRLPDVSDWCHANRDVASASELAVAGALRHRSMNAMSTWSSRPLTLFAHEDAHNRARGIR